MRTSWPQATKRSSQHGINVAPLYKSHNRLERFGSSALNIIDRDTRLVRGVSPGRAPATSEEREVMLGQLHYTNPANGKVTFTWQNSDDDETRELVT